MVDFDDVEIELLQLCEVGKFGVEIVELDLNVECVQLFDVFLCLGFECNVDIFGYFQCKFFW